MSAFRVAEAGDRAGTESTVLWGFASLPQISQGPSSEGGAAARAVPPAPAINKKSNKIGGMYGRDII